MRKGSKGRVKSCLLQATQSRFLVSRPVPIEFPGAVCHVTSRGDRRGPVYRDDEDRTAQLDVIAQVMHRFDAQLLA